MARIHPGRMGHLAPQPAWIGIARVRAGVQVQGLSPWRVKLKGRWIASGGGTRARGVYA